MERLLRANIHYLNQAATLLDRLDDKLYSQPVDNFYGSSVGGHLRHCIEHYFSFLRGMESGRVDYDDRRRDERIETGTAEAAKALDKISSELGSLLEGGVPVGLLVKMDCGFEEIEWQPSTMGRELQFLVSHTVHHFAMIGGICRALEVALDDSFGVAPSTIRHRAQMEVS